MNLELPKSPRLGAEYRRRRRKLARLIDAGVALLTAAPTAGLNTLYRPDPDLRYLTGHLEATALLALSANRGRITSETLYCQPRNSKRERWDGRVLGPRDAVRVLGLAQAEALNSIPAAVSTALAGEHTALFNPSAADSLTSAALKHFHKAKSSPSSSGLTTLRSLRPLLDELRLIKSPYELGQMKAAAITAASAARRAIAALPGCSQEKEIAALLANSYAEAGTTHAFPPIVASGANAGILHYIANSAALNKKGLVLIDTGCELNGYASDLSRTVPATGKFSPAQLDLYETVLAAQLAAISKVYPGNSLVDAEQAAQRQLIRGLRHMGILRGSLATIRRSGELRRFYMHRIGHWIGMDVHDVGNYHNQTGEPRPLQPGMCLTIEPGLYLDRSRAVPPELRHAGIRIEDSLAVTRSGTKVLTAGVPKTAAQLSALMSR